MRLRAVIETAIDGIITINRRGQIETINRAARELFGYTSEELVGKNVHVLMPTPYHEEHDGYLQRYHETRKPHIIGIGREVEGRKKDGTVFPLRLAVNEVRLPDQVIYTGVIHDLTEVKAAEHALERLNAQLEAKVEARTRELDRANRGLREALDREKELGELKSRFVSLTSHEFRTPLSTILSSAELIEAYTREDQQPRREKHVKRIKKSVRGLTEILNDMLTLSRLEEGKVKVELKDVVVTELVDEVIEELSGRHKNGQCIEYTHRGHPVIVSDGKLLRHILQNLLSNALKYSPENCNVECRTENREHEFYLHVRDRGIGIPEADQKHLFTRFFRADNVENIQGTGLGLNIVRQYAEELNGSVRFESIEGEGTTFYLNLPLRT